MFGVWFIFTTFVNLYGSLPRIFSDYIDYYKAEGLILSVKIIIVYLVIIYIFSVKSVKICGSKYRNK